MRLIPETPARLRGHEPPANLRWVHGDPGITRPPFWFLSFFEPGLTHFGLVAGALSPNSLLNARFAGLGLLLALFCGGASLACSFGDELDLDTDEGKSASVGEGRGFGFAGGGGDLVKK